MGLLDFLTGGSNTATDPNANTNGLNSPQGAFGLDPATAKQVQQSQAWNGLLGFLAGAGQSAAPSRLPVPTGLVMGNALAAQQNALNDTAKQAQGMAQTADTMSQTQLRRIQGNASLIGLQNQQQMLKALQQFYTGGNGADGSTAPPLVATSPISPTGQPTPTASTPGSTGNVSDPRGMIPVITASAQKYGIDPDVAIRVASTEGLRGGAGDGGKSFGAFQLYTGGGLGNDFANQTHQDPSLPQNEPATIDFALQHASQYGWGAFHGAKNNGISNWQGITRPGSTQTASKAGSPPEYYLGAMSADDSTPATSGVNPTGTAGIQGLPGSPSGPSPDRPTPTPAPTLTSYGGAAGIPGLPGSPSGPSVVPPSSMNGGMGTNPTGTAGIPGLQGSPSGPAPTLTPAQQQGLLAKVAPSPSGVTQFAPPSIQALGPAAMQQWQQQMQGLGYKVGDPTAGNLPPGVANLAQGLLGALSPGSPAATASAQPSQMASPASPSPAGTPAVSAPGQPAPSPVPQTPGLLNPQAGAVNTPPPAAPSPGLAGIGTTNGVSPPPSVTAGIGTQNPVSPAPSAVAGIGTTPLGSPQPPQPLQQGMVPNVVGVPGMPAMPSPQKIQQAQFLAATMSVMGQKVPPDLEALSKFPVDLALANAKAYAEKSAENQFAGSIATQQQQARVGPESAINANRANAESYYRSLYAGPEAQSAAAGKEAGNPTLVTVPMPDGQGGYKDAQIPKSQYLASIGQGQPDANNLPGKPMVNPQAEFNMKVYQPVIDSDNKRIAETLQPAADTANTTFQTASLIHDLSQNVRTGWGANSLQSMGQVLSRLGVPDENIQKLTQINPSDGNALQKLFLQQASDAVRKLGAREPGSVISMFSKAYPSLETQPQAIALMENVFKMQAQRDQDHLNQAQQFQTQQLANVRNGQAYTPLSTFETQFNSGQNTAVNYSKAAEVMSGMPAGWKGLNSQQQKDVWGLIPKGTQIVGPSGQTVIR